uniref:Putative secreted protein n=1 Tax=Ixodes ricinus TaxID=34613 RepID=A0A6B0ULE2_IXORI
MLGWGTAALLSVTATMGAVLTPFFICSCSQRSSSATSSCSFSWLLFSSWACIMASRARCFSRAPVFTVKLMRPSSSSLWSSSSFLVRRDFSSGSCGSSGTKSPISRAICRCFLRA